MTASQSRARSSRGRTTCRPWSRFPPWSRSHEEGGNKSLSPGLQGLSTGLYFSQGQEQSLWRDVIHCNSFYQLFFFWMKKLRVIFLCIFRIIFSTIVCEERNVQFFFLFRICRNFNLESSLNCFPKTFPRKFFLPFGVTFLTDRLIINKKVYRGDSMSIFFLWSPKWL